jgi:hypothetical protein
VSADEKSRQYGVEDGGAAVTGQQSLVLALGVRDVGEALVERCSWLAGVGWP